MKKKLKNFMSIFNGWTYVALAISILINSHYQSFYGLLSTGSFILLFIALELKRSNNTKELTVAINDLKRHFLKYKSMTEESVKEAFYKGSESYGKYPNKELAYIEFTEKLNRKNCSMKDNLSCPFINEVEKTCDKCQFSIK